MGTIGDAPLYYSNTHTINPIQPGLSDHGTICVLIKEIYADLPGHQTPDGRTIPSSICLTPDRPDIIIIDRSSCDLFIFELTMSFDWDENFQFSHTHKENKYAYFLTDITELTPHVCAFEVGARGYITKENNDRLRSLHKFCQKKIKFNSFVRNISALSVNASYYMFICRKDPVWSDPPLLCAPFNTEWHHPLTNQREMQRYARATGSEPTLFYSDNKNIVIIMYYGDGAWEKSSYNVAFSFSVALGDFCLLVYDK